MAAKGKSSIFATLIVYMIYTSDYTGSIMFKSNWISSMESESVKYGQKVSNQKIFFFSYRDNPQSSKRAFTIVDCVCPCPTPG